MSETPSKRDFFNVYDWLVCNIDTELREPTLRAGEHMRLYLRSEPSELTKGLILKYLVGATPGMPEYLPFRHPEQAPGVLEKCLRDKVEWLPFAAKSLGGMLCQASNKLKEMGISLYESNGSDIWSLESLQLLQAECRTVSISIFLDFQRKGILQGLSNKRAEKQHIQPLIPEGTKWQDIKLVFKDGYTVSVYLKGKHHCRANYTEMGFKNEKDGNPIKSWCLLQRFSKGSGVINGYPHKEKAKVEKEVSILRKKLHACFMITDDPIRYIEGEGYKTLFTITECEPSEKYRKHEMATDLYDMEKIADDDYQDD